MLTKYETAEDAVIRLKKLIKKIEQAYSHFDNQEISRSQFRIILPIIKDSKGYSAAELAELTGVDKALVSRAIADLESKGIVVRDKKADSDEKKYKIILGEKGKEFLTQQMAKAKSVSAEWLNGVTRDELIVFNNTLVRLTEK